MRNIKSIHDLTDLEREEMFLATKKAAVAFVPMTEECVVVTAEGDAYRIDDWYKYYIAVGCNGDMWPVSHEFYLQNYEELPLIEQEQALKAFLTKLVLDKD